MLSLPKFFMHSYLSPLSLFSCYVFYLLSLLSFIFSKLLLYGLWFTVSYFSKSDWIFFYRTLTSFLISFINVDWNLFPLLILLIIYIEFILSFWFVPFGGNALFLYCLDSGTTIFSSFWYCYRTLFWFNDDGSCGILFLI